MTTPNDIDELKSQSQKIAGWNNGLNVNECLFRAVDGSYFIVRSIHNGITKSDARRWAELYCGTEKGKELIGD